MTGYSLAQVCSLPDMPSESTVYSWLAQSGHPFLERYARAREIQAERWADEIIHISDDISKDVIGELQMPNNVAVSRAKLRTENRKWIASKLLPKKYGDRGISDAVKESANRLDELVAAMRSGPVKRGKVNPLARTENREDPIK